MSTGEAISEWLPLGRRDLEAGAHISCGRN